MFANDNVCIIFDLQNNNVFVKSCKRPFINPFSSGYLKINHGKQVLTSQKREFNPVLFFLNIVTAINYNSVQFFNLMMWQCYILNCLW